jgi:hypothetical protein
MGFITATVDVYLIRDAITVQIKIEEVCSRDTSTSLIATRVLFVRKHFSFRPIMNLNHFILN